MSPVRDAPLTSALALALVAVHAVLWLTRGLEAAVLAGALIPARLSGAVALGGVPAVLTPLSSSLLHANLLHLGFNLLILVFCGTQVERVLGAGRTALLLLVGAYGAALGEWALDPGSLVPVIGASGAISAEIAAYSLFYGPQRARAIGPLSADLVRALWLGAAWVLLNVAQGLAFGTLGTSIAIGEHIGGFAVGLLLARPLARSRWGR